MYNSRSKLSRNELAQVLLETLEKAGFQRLGSVANEEIYFRDEGRFRVKVYTTIRSAGVGAGHARPKGRDSIKVSATRIVDGNEIGWIKTTPVHRVGDIHDIANRMLGRMRLAWGDALVRCRREGILPRGSK